MTAQPFPLDFQPGIQRDGTKFDANRYLDSLWCRWRLGRPRKMGGFQSIYGGLNGLPRRVHCYFTGSNIVAHIGTTAGIQQVIFDTSGNLISTADRTPPTFASGINVGFTMDAIFDTTSNVVQLVAHAVPDTSALASGVTTTPFIGQLTSSTALAPFTAPSDTLGGTWTQPSVAGGIVCVQPYVFDFDANGFVGWSAPNLPLTLGVTGGSSGAGQARISAQKIVYGYTLRGGGSQSPAALFWSLSEVITATFIGGAPVWAFNTISPSSSILSSDAVIEYDGLYFWPGIDRFLVFNGTVTEVRNDQNQDWFFSNLTPGFEARTYAIKIPRYGEIWWLACMFGATEPNFAIIYNIRDNVWYDTMLPDGGRSAGYFAQGFRYPVMADTTQGAKGYTLWMHEIGTDKVVGAIAAAVRSYFETPWFGGPKNSPPSDAGLSFHQLEPDVIQQGDLSCYLIGASNPRAPEVQGPVVTLNQVPPVPQAQFASFTPTMPLRLTRLHVESNVIGGNYVFGRSLGHAEPASPRLIS